MSKEKASHTSFILDTCAILDFYKADESFFTHFKNGSVKLCVVSPNEELEPEFRSDEDHSRFLKSGIKEIEYSTDILLKLKQKTPLSGYDQIVMWTAQKKNFTLVTNDKNLRKSCDEIGVEVVWSLELLVVLCDKRVIEKQYARNIGIKIQKKNSKFIRDDILKNFLNKIEEIE